jgi:hypothetical protein
MGKLERFVINFIGNYIPKINSKITNIRICNCKKIGETEKSALGSETMEEVGSMERLHMFYISHIFRAFCVLSFRSDYNQLNN